MKQVLVTGGTGFVGSHLVASLSQDSEIKLHLTAYSAESNDKSKVDAQVHTLDLTQLDQTTQLISTLQPDEIYHLASLAEVGKSFNQVQHVIESNTRIQLNLLEAVRQHAPNARVLVIGSAMSYDLAGNYDQYSPDSVDETFPLGPLSPYAVSKTTQDMLAYAYARNYNLNIIRVRPFNHIGEGQTPDFAIASFAQQLVKIERGEQSQLKVGNLEAVRDLMDVKDVVRAYQLLMAQGEPGQVYNLGGGRGYSMQQVLDMMIQVSGIEAQVVVDEDRLRPADIPVAIANPSKINQLGWQPEIELKDTLERIINYWRSQS